MKFEIFNHIVQDKVSFEALKKGYTDTIHDMGVSITNIKTLLLNKNLSPRS